MLVVVVYPVFLVEVSALVLVECEVPDFEVEVVEDGEETVEERLVRLDLVLVLDVADFLVVEIGDVDCIAVVGSEEEELCSGALCRSCLMTDDA